MIARVRRWGNSLALRLRKPDIERAGIAEGDLVRVEILGLAKASQGALNLPTFEDPDPQASVHHDKYLYR